MLIFLPLTLIIASVLIAYAVLFRRGQIVGQTAEQRDHLAVSESEISPLAHVLEARIAQFSRQFSFFFKQLGHYLYFYWLLVMRKLVVLARVILTLFERKFSLLIESVRGKGVIGKRGAVSLFLSSLSRNETNPRTDR